MKNTKPNRKVRFCEDDQVEQVDIVENDDCDAVWYTRQDLQEIRRQESSEGIKDDPAVDCDNVSCFKFDQQRQKEFVSAVLKQQLEHKQMGMYDPKGLFQLSKAFSKKSRQEALKVARNQEKEVKVYLSEKERTLDILDDALELLAADL